MNSIRMYFFLCKDRSECVTVKMKCFLYHKLLLLTYNCRGKTTFGLNQLADLSQKEFSRIVLMPKRRAPVFEKER